MRTITVEKLPQRLEAITIASDWGLNDSCQLRLQLVNESAEDWTEVTVKGDCSCSKVEIDEESTKGATSGDFIVANINYSKPKDPGITPTRLRFTFNGSPVILPVLVEWYSPVVLQKLQQLKPDVWRVNGYVKQGWNIASVSALNDDVDTELVRNEKQSFAINLLSNVRGTRSCWLRFQLKSSVGENSSLQHEPSAKSKSTEQICSLSLESNEPRCIPSRLACRVGKEGTLAGDARIYFPRTGLGPRPNLDRLVLISADENEIPLTVTQKPLGKAALKVEFVSEGKVSSNAFGSDARIRFIFDNNTHFDRSFLVSSE